MGRQGGHYKKVIGEKYKRFLLESARVHEVAHSGRRLYNHLCGTHDLLQEWGNPEPVNLAGLFHSIYGTRKFHHKSWPLADRRTIRDLIGQEAELLAYIFCTSKRSAFLGTQGAMMAQLREIEAANLLEQKAPAKRLGRLCDSGISNCAMRAMDRHLLGDFKY